MQADAVIIADFFIKTVGTPRIGEKADADGAAKVVELEATRRHGVHDGCIMNNFHWNLGAHYTNFNFDQGGSNLLFVATGEQVRVRGGGKWVSNNQKSDLMLGCVRQAFVRTLLNKISVSNNHIASIKLRLRNKCSLWSTDAPAARGHDGELRCSSPGTRGRISSQSPTPILVRR